MVDPDVGMRYPGAELEGWGKYEFWAEISKPVVRSLEVLWDVLHSQPSSVAVSPWGALMEK